jgi:integral membrane sensor domain MASE1
MGGVWVAYGWGIGGAWWRLVAYGCAITSLYTYQKKARYKKARLYEKKLLAILFIVVVIMRQPRQQRGEYSKNVI